MTEYDAEFALRSNVSDPVLIRYGPTFRVRSADRRVGCGSKTRRRCTNGSANGPSGPERWLDLPALVCRHLFEVVRNLYYRA